MSRAGTALKAVTAAFLFSKKLGTYVHQSCALTHLSAVHLPPVFVHEEIWLFADGVLQGNLRLVQEAVGQIYKMSQAIKL